jgi:hypothetical protein
MGINKDARRRAHEALNFVRTLPPDVVNIVARKLGIDPSKEKDVQRAIRRTVSQGTFANRLNGFADYIEALVENEIRKQMKQMVAEGLATITIENGEEIIELTELGNDRARLTQLGENN